MSSRRPTSVCRTPPARARGLLLAALVLASCQAPEDTPEIRGVWITNVDCDVLQSRAGITEAMRFLAEHGFNVVYPVVWNDSRTLWPSEVMAERFGLPIGSRYAGRDPLQEVIIEAHRHGIEVVPWFEYGFAASYANPEGGHILAKKPEWKALDREGNLATKNGFQWMNGFDPGVQEFLTSLVTEVVLHYDVDGIQGDDRLPAMPSLAGYDPLTTARYRAEFGEDPPPDPKDERWVRWRADLLTAFLTRLRGQVRSLRPDVAIAMAPSHYDWSLHEYLQDSVAWVRQGLVESLSPQAYRYDLPAYRRVIDDIVDHQLAPDQLRLLAPGMLIKLGDYRIDTDWFVEAVAYHRERGAHGEVFFFYPGLRENDDELARVLRERFYREPARLPYREGVWRPRPAVFAPEGGAARPFLLPPGEPGPVVTRITVPVTATYDLFTRLDASQLRLAGTARYELEGADPGPAASTVIRPSQLEPDVWVPVLTASLAAGREHELLLHRADPDAGTGLAAGPVMVMLNRRLSPDAVWTD